MLWEQRDQPCSLGTELPKAFPEAVNALCRSLPHALPARVLGGQDWSVLVAWRGDFAFWRVLAESHGVLLFLPEVQGLLLCWQPVVALGCEVLRRSKLDPISLVVSGSWGGDLVMHSVLWERPPTDGWLRGGNRAKCTKNPAAFNVLGASSKGMLVDMVSVTALGQLVTMIPSGEQERVPPSRARPSDGNVVKRLFLRCFLQEK